MTRYAQNGGLTRFDTGGTHSQNPNGGINIGNNNSVEENETKSGNFVYSNRIFLDSNVVSQYNLPKSLVGKSVADATKLIDNKFKGRNDKISQSTKNSMLSKVAEAQESMKPPEPEIEQPQEDMESQIPEGMMNPSQMALGGYINKMAMGGDPTINTSDNSTQSGIVDDKINNYNNYISAATAISRPIANSIYNGGDQQRDVNIQSVNTIGQGVGSAIGGKAGGTVGNAVTAATGLYEMGSEAFGKSKIDTSGINSINSANSGRAAGAGALKGAGTGAAIGSIIPGVGTLIGAGVGAVVGGVTGFIGGKKDESAQLLNNNKYSNRYNSQFSDQYALGGDLDIDPPSKKIKNSDGSYSIINTSTKQVTSGSVGTTIPGTPGSPAVLPSARGVNATDPGRNKAFAQARAAGLPTFNYNGKAYTTDIKLATPGRAAVNPTPAIVTPSVSPTYETQTSIESIPSQVYNVQAQRGTAGTGVLRPGIGGGITTNNQYTANQDVANRALHAQQVYNEDVNKRYAPVVNDGRSNNSAQLANRNAKAELRRQQLQGTATVNEIPTQLGLERKKVEVLRNTNSFAMGGRINQMAEGGDYYENLKLNARNQDPNALQNFLKPVGTTVPYTIGTQPTVDISNANRQFTPGPSNLDILKYNANKVGSTINNNLGNLARYAPIATNAFQLSQLKKPQGERLDRLSNRYKPEYVDEVALQNIANNSMNNAVSSIGQSGASQGQIRSSILGSQLQRTNAVSDAYNQASSQNRATNDRAQQFNSSIDQVNLQQSNSEKDINARDQAAYRNEKSKYISAIGNDIGDVGKEQIEKKIIAKTTGYKWDGEYVKSPDGNVVTDPDTKKPMTIEKLKQLQSSGTVKKQALGGYLIKNKVK